jgi:uncharacterized protein YcaQ
MSLGKALIRDLLRTHATVTEAVRALGAVQIDPVQVVGRNHEIVLSHRVRTWSPGKLHVALARGQLVEVYAQARCLVPVEDLPLHGWRFAAAREAYAPYFHKHRGEVERLLGILDERGPVGPRDLRGPRVEKRHEWASSNLYTTLLELLWRAGRIVIAERRGNDKRYARIERVVPPEHLAGAASARDREELELRRVERYVRAVRLAHLREPHFGFSDLRAADKARILGRLLEEGRIARPADPALAGRYVMAPDFAARRPRGAPPAPALLSPLDNLLWSRQRLEDLWGLHYRWEIYHPKHKRTLAPYAMVLVACDRVLGQAAVKSDRKNGRLDVRGFSPAAGVAPHAAHEALVEAAEGLRLRLGLDRLRVAPPRRRIVARP